MPAGLLYGPAYRSFDQAVAERRLNLLPERCLDPFVEACLDPAFPLVFVVLDGVWAARENPPEAQLAAQLVAGLRSTLRRADGKLFGDDGGLFPRRRVCGQSASSADPRDPARTARQRRWQSPPLVDTVDKMQGREADAVIVSYGVSDPEFAAEEAEFIYGLNRLNVAVTRARAKCIVCLPRPLLDAPPQVLDLPEAARGLAFMREIGPGRVARRRGIDVRSGGRRAGRGVPDAGMLPEAGRLAPSRKLESVRVDRRTIWSVALAETRQPRFRQDPALFRESAANLDRGARARSTSAAETPGRYRRTGRGRKAAGAVFGTLASKRGRESFSASGSDQVAKPISENDSRPLAPSEPDSLLARLNDPQREAASHGLDPLLIIAGAGTGKTTTLVYRVAQLISQGVPPERILLLTFTRRAAAQMVERVAAVLRDADVDRSVWGGTFHGTGTRLLRQYGKAIGIHPRFTIHDQGDAEDLMGALCREMDLGKDDKQFPEKPTCLAIHSYGVNAELPLSQVLDAQFPQHQAYAGGAAETVCGLRRAQSRLERF